MSLEPPQKRVPVANAEGLTLYGYLLLQGYYDALVEANETIATQAAEIAALDVRVTALEP